ncbi:thioredoxin-related transmembrane protein 1-like [Limulus polyphemus]|uniref:Thioredoxin-related transmembrane protein 1-like n=1 Tax=Limulus polyphemus TaxID=6850 RepID=A0ABM1C4W6_LIMPO|nr:thioredoxin-related transmembrane protein 1-like [Limulus polyphemus]
MATWGICNIKKVVNGLPSLCSSKSLLKSLFLLTCFINLYPTILGKGQLLSLDEDNWQEMLSGEWMVEFFAPWCPACKALEPVWKEFSDWSDDLGIKVGSVDVTQNPGMSGRFMVTALPTIYHVIDGQFRQYRGSRDKVSFINFIEEKKWSSIDPVSWWQSPQSIIMSTISYFFKLSMALRSAHNKIVEEYGIPYWGSYIIFALGTIILGAILGLMIVCIIDFFFPPKVYVQEVSEKIHLPEEELDSGDVEEEDVIEDDSTKDNQELRRRNIETEQAEK